MASEPVKTYKVRNASDPTGDTLTITSDAIWQSAVLTDMFALVDDEFLSEDVAIPLGIENISTANLRLVFSWLNRHKTDATDAAASNQPCNFEAFWDRLIDQDEIPSEVEDALSQQFRCRKPTKKIPQPRKSRKGGHQFKHKNPQEITPVSLDDIDRLRPRRGQQRMLVRPHRPLAKDINIPDNIKVVYRPGDAKVLCAADQQVLFQVARVANYLELESLLELVLHAIALRILPLKNAEEMRGFFRVVKDFEKAEQKKMGREFRWVERRDATCSRCKGKACKHVRLL